MKLVKNVGGLNLKFNKLSIYFGITFIGNIYIPSKKIEGFLFELPSININWGYDDLIFHYTGLGFYFGFSILKNK